MWKPVAMILTVLLISVAMLVLGERAEGLGEFFERHFLVLTLAAIVPFFVPWSE